ncbi:MAG: dephospho-CoA kinase [Fidelibacterota bacterium]|nr:MAG: dephospho-CoA kinase [Candidatus Neomarinimicrobiota bacterium]
MMRIGITGGLGSGKSTAARFFGDRSAHIFDADMEAKFILLRHEPIQRAVVAALGDSVLNEVGEIDFGRLANYAFAKAERQRRLNEIIHPEVILVAEREMLAASRKGKTMFVLDVPLLFEAHMEQYLDYTLAVVADEELRIERAMQRMTLTEAEIRRRTRLQLSDEERSAMADFVVHNNGTIEELHQQLQDIYDTLLETQRS